MQSKTRIGIQHLGRNAEKRAARQAERTLRSEVIKAKRAAGCLSTTPKIKRSRAMIGLLANRRLRQRQQVRP